MWSSWSLKGIIGDKVLSMPPIPLTMASRINHGLNATHKKTIARPRSDMNITTKPSLYALQRFTNRLHKLLSAMNRYLINPNLNNYLCTGLSSPERIIHNKALWIIGAKEDTPTPFAKCFCLRSPYPLNLFIHINRYYYWWRRYLLSRSLLIWSLHSFATWLNLAFIACGGIHRPLENHGLKA
jgi:hypothetical protein